MSIEQKAWIRANARPNQWVDLDAVEADLEAAFGLRIQGPGPSAVIRNGASITPFRGAWDAERAARYALISKLAAPPPDATRLTIGYTLVGAIAATMGYDDKPGGSDYLDELAFIEGQ